MFGERKPPPVDWEGEEREDAGTGGVVVNSDETLVLVS